MAEHVPNIYKALHLNTIAKTKQQKPNQSWVYTFKAGAHL